MLLHWARCATILVALQWQHVAQADTVEDFYHGKTVTIYVGFGAGGGYDAYAQLLAPHMRRHIPGNPSVIVKHMPGAGSLALMNYLWSVAAPDGTSFGIPASNAACNAEPNRERSKYRCSREIPEPGVLSRPRL